MHCRANFTCSLSFGFSTLGRYDCVTCLATHNARTNGAQKTTLPIQGEVTRFLR